MPLILDDKWEERLRKMWQQFSGDAKPTRGEFRSYDGEPPKQRWFRITAATQDGTNYRWVYTMIEIYKSGDGYNQWTDVTDGIETTKGYNGVEDQNGSSGTFGVNIAFTNLDGTFELKPLNAGCRVWARPVINSAGDIEWWFVASNQADGGCP